MASCYVASYVSLLQAFLLGLPNTGKEGKKEGRERGKGGREGGKEKEKRKQYICRQFMC